MNASKTSFFSTVSLVAIIGALSFPAHAIDNLDVWGGPYFALGGAGKFARGESSPEAYGFAELGYDFSVPNSEFVVGVVGNIDLGSIEENHSRRYDYRIGNSWGIGVRAGIKPMHSLLLYGVGGFNQAEISGDCISKCPKGGSDDINETWEAGYFLGAGVEKAFSDNVAAKLEYRYEDYGDVEDLDDMDSHSVRGSLVFRMGKHGDDY
ncbi:outer membrane protein [Pararhizobium sp. IMCC21322]|uniref:outer membrane protein n=1 Tax=Pararhizobium sp. IMCC21322 TaxID=3067903 RepID=UPI002741B2C3|nr:outer membrane beta-barrel protein [Pararhizobium sp. IMCC21322]